jgi:signal peptidase I
VPEGPSDSDRPVEEPRTVTATDPNRSAPGAITQPAPPRDAFASGRGDHPNEREDDQGSHGALSFLRELPILIVLAFALAIVLKTFVVQAFYIPSASMEPLLLPGDRVLNKVLYHPHRGDVIVFEDPHPGPEADRGLVGGVLHWLSQGLGFAQPSDEDFIKRIVGMPGETVEIHAHHVLIDGQSLDEPYLTRAARQSMGDFGPVQVPDDALFVMGDNRGNSDDSRGSLGFIPLSKVVGRAFVKIWPPGRSGWLH